MNFLMQPSQFIHFLLCPSDFPLRMIYLYPSFLLKITSKAHCSTQIPSKFFMKTSQTIIAENELLVLISFCVFSSHTDMLDLVIPFLQAYYPLDGKILEARTISYSRKIFLQKVVNKQNSTLQKNFYFLDISRSLL